MPYDIALLSCEGGDAAARGRMFASGASRPTEKAVALGSRWSGPSQNATTVQWKRCRAGGKGLKGSLTLGDVVGWHEPSGALVGLP
jgi:hypothetical protein